VKITAEQITEAIEALERLRADLPAAYDLDHRLGCVERPDGFRTSVRPMDGSRSSTDDAGEALPPHSDPTGSTVVTLIDGTGRRSSVRDEVEMMTGCLLEIRGLARQADGARARVMLPDGTALDPEQCEVHKRHGFAFEPPFCRSRCRWCYDFWLAEGVDAPADLLQAKAEGRRISRKMVADAVRHQPKAKSRRRRTG